MNLNNKEKGILEAMTEKITPITEFEVRFGLPIRKFGGDKNRISRKKFIDMLRYFRDNYTIAGNKTLLDIWFKNPNNFNRNNIRVTLEGVDAVSEFCKTDKFDPSLAEIVYKNNVFWTPKELDTMINDKRIWTEYEEGGRRRRLTADLDSDMGVRFSVKTELPIVYNRSGKYVVDPKYLRNNDISESEKRDKKNLLKFVYNDLDQFRTFNKHSLKTFRYKRRFSFYSADKQFRYDFTMVKSSRKNSRNQLEYTKTFTSSRVLNGLEEYEFEMEYIGERKPSSVQFIKSLRENVYDIMKHIQNSDTPITIVEKDTVVDNYKNLIIGNWVSRIKEKIALLEADKDGEHGKELNMLGKRLKNYTFMKDGKETISDRVRVENTFIGPKPFTLELENFGKADVNPLTIEEGYSVTDKADGVRMLMFIDKLGEIYYIDNRFNIRKKTLKKYKTKVGLRNTLIDGEWVEHKSDGTRLDKFYAFDIYFKGGSSVEDLPLGGKAGRYEILKEVMNDIKSEVKDVEDHFWFKKFYFADKGNDIFKLSKMCYEDDHVYNIDGLIFTPTHLPVGVDAQSVSSFKLDKKSKHYTFNSTSGSWKRALKWKPLEEQSIDFFVQYDTRDGKPVILNKLVEIDGITQSVSYKRLILSIGSNKKDKEFMMKMNPCSEVAGAVVSSKTGNYTVPMRFRPPFNSYKDIDVANIPITGDGRFVTVDGVKSGNILGSVADTRGINIRNNSVVEFVYDGNAPTGFCWKVLRVREDKTEEYDRLVSKRGTIYRLYMEHREVINRVISFSEEHNYTISDRNTVNKLWKDCGLLLKAFGVRMRGTRGPKNNEMRERVRSLRDAMSFDSKSIIRSEEDIPIHFNYGNYYTTAYNVWNAINNPVTKEMLFGDEEIPKLTDDRYYRGVSDDDPTAKMRKFHNRYIKSTLIHMATEGKRDPSLLDLCCGKGGDLYKWKSAGVKRVLGVDVSRDNIYNRSDGACVRYMNMARTMDSVNHMDVDFLVGDCGELMSDLEAFTDDRSREYYRDTYLDMDGNPTQFDVVSTQFAIHYFFNSVHRVDAYLKNVNAHLKKGGFFIGTVLDGESVYDRLCAIPSETMIKDVDKHGNLVWSIERKFDCSRTGRDFHEDNNPINFKIDIRLPSITGEGDSYEEWLVNFKYLKRRAQKFGLKLYKDGNLRDGTGLFDTLYNKNLRKDSRIEMSEEECNLSFMYRYFIFIKE